MKTTLRQACSRFLDILGLVTFACIALSLAIPGLMPAQVRAMVAMPTASAIASIDYANCLWYTARNQGFYSLQHAVATESGTEANRQLWLQLIESIEATVCDSRNINMEDLTSALADTVSDADRHFLAIRQSF